MNPEFHNLLLDLRHDLDHPDFWWQIVALLLCLSVAALMDRMLRQRRRRLRDEGVLHGVGINGVARVFFPVAAALLLFVSRALLSLWHPVNLLSIALPLVGSLAVIRAVFYALRISFSQAAWLGSFERVFSLVVWLAVTLHILGLLNEMVQVAESVSFTVGKQKLNLWVMGQGIFIVIASLLVALWLGGVAEARLAAAEGLDGNLRLVLSRVMRSLLVLIAVLLSLPLVGIDLTTLSVFGGALGVGLGFGLQKVASNYVSGFIILLDRSIRIGNMIAVGADRGEVTRITTRYTVLRALNGVEAIVPNDALMSSVVLNESLTDRRVRVAVLVQVAYKTDLEQAMALLVEAAKAQARVLADPAPAALVTAFADSGINLELGFWISDPEAGSGGLKSDIYLTIWRSFKAANIEIPYPQREVRVIGGDAKLPA
ncbi:MAG TPA: mechanosensitive ion channel domain-containing protein [Rhodocyclaceae bacterium]|nr:mechanosensitive ion channel domain-containing protein [Rhodocyclaceae bacterium]